MSDSNARVYQDLEETREALIAGIHRLQNDLRTVEDALSQFQHQSYEKPTKTKSVRQAKPKLKLKRKEPEPESESESSSRSSSGSSSGSESE